jgi:hypothetical protein
MSDDYEASEVILKHYWPTEQKNLHLSHVRADYLRLLQSPKGQAGQQV